MIQPNFTNPVLYSGPGLPPTTSGGGSLGQIFFPIKTDIDLINDSIKQICQTNPGERWMRPNYGAGLNRLLFESDATVLHKLGQMIISQAIAAVDPRITLLSVSVVATLHTVVVSYAFRVVKVGLNGRGFLEFPRQV